MIRTNKGRKPGKTKAIILSQAPEIITSRKFNKWCEYYFDESNKQTYFNATQSALKVYNTENVSSAGHIGWENYKKLQTLASTVADLSGFGFNDLVKIGIQKMMMGEYSDWDKFMVRLGYFQDKPTALTQNIFDFSNLGSAIKQARQERGLSI